ncbi:MAG: hypothetical protein J6X84_00175 [Treponema sp.]|nr:hypothetical protein [Treponema sp.]
MFKQIKKYFFAILLKITILFSLFSCKTTSTLERQTIPQEDKYVITRELDLSPNQEESKYIFIRLYNPEYKNPFYVANILKGGLNATQVDETPELSHASINFSLDDNFYGLTSGGKYQLAQEACLYPQDNKYMKNCDPARSEQITYAIKVSPEEYENAKKFVENYADSTDIKYKSYLNFKIAMFCIKRKFFTAKEKKAFGSVVYPKRAQNKKIQGDEWRNENDFVCSTFVAYVLYNNVNKITDFFDENNIKYDYINVSDLVMIPGIIPLFYSTWENYLIAANAFIEEYPEFQIYLTE